MTLNDLDMIQDLLRVADEIAHDPRVDLVHSERRIQLYAALAKCRPFFASLAILTSAHSAMTCPRATTCCHCAGDMTKNTRCSNDGRCVSIEEFERAGGDHKHYAEGIIETRRNAKGIHGS